MGLPGGSRCFNRVPRALLVIIKWSKAQTSPTGIHCVVDLSSSVLPTTCNPQVAAVGQTAGAGAEAHDKVCVDIAEIPIYTD